MAWAWKRSSARSCIRAVIAIQAPFVGKRTLVIGYGNSGAEIALDLAEAGIDVVLSVRSPVNIVPRELFGVPILSFPAAEQWLPPRVADALNAPLIRFAIGSQPKSWIA